MWEEFFESQLPDEKKEAQGTAINMNEKERNPNPGTSDRSDWTLLNLQFSLAVSGWAPSC